MKVRIIFPSWILLTSYYLQKQITFADVITVIFQVPSKKECGQGVEQLGVQEMFIRVQSKNIHKGTTYWPHLENSQVSINNKIDKLLKFTNAI